MEALSGHFGGDESRADLQPTSPPQDRHLRSKTLPGAPGASILRPRTEGFASRGPRNPRSKGTLPKIRGTLYVGRRCIVEALLRHLIFPAGPNPYWDPTITLCYAIVLPGRKPAFRAGFCRTATGKALRLVLRPAFGRPEGRFRLFQYGPDPARKSDFRPGSTIAYHRVQRS